MNVYENAMNVLFRKYHGKAIEDWGSTNSPHMKQFAKDVRRTLKLMPDVKLEDLSLGHYYISGFFSKDGKYAYFSYDVPRGELPLDMERHDAFRGILVRTAKNLKDYTGGHNYFCAFGDFDKKVMQLLEAA